MESGRYDPINECVSITLAFFAVRDFKKLLLLCVYILRQMFVVAKSLQNTRTLSLIQDSSS